MSICVAVAAEGKKLPYLLYLKVLRTGRLLNSCRRLCEKECMLHKSERLDGQPSDAALDRENVEDSCRRVYKLCSGIGPNGNLRIFQIN